METPCYFKQDVVDAFERLEPTSSKPTDWSYFNEYTIENVFPLGSSPNILLTIAQLFVLEMWEYTILSLVSSQRGAGRVA